MFAGKNFSENVSNEAEMNEFDPEVVDNFIQLLYVDDLSDRKLNSLGLLLLADKYNVVGLRKNCEKALSKLVNTSNAIPLLCTASRIEAPLLIERSANFIFKHLDALVGTANWKKLVETSAEVMALIFKHRSA